MEYNKITDIINIKGIIIHHAYKEAMKTECTLKIAKQDIVPTEEYIKFIHTVHSSYYNKRTNKAYGVFDGENPEFETNLNAYLKRKNEENSFYNFTISLMNHFKNTIKNVSPATGGSVIFCHYTKTDKNNEYLLILTTNNKDGFQIDENTLTIKQIQNIDLSKLDVACIINLTRYNQYLSGTSSEEILSYLSFIKGRKDVSNYFSNFIGCGNKTTSKEETKKLLSVLKKFYRAENFDSEKVELINNKIYEHLQNKDSIRLDSISILIDTDNPEKFVNFASQEEFELSSEIRIDTKTLSDIKYVRFNPNNKINIKFDRNLLITGDIEYNEETQELLIKNVPVDVIEG